MLLGSLRNASDGKMFMKAVDCYGNKAPVSNLDSVRRKFWG